MTPHRRRLLTALQVAFAVAVVWYAGRRLVERWSEFEQADIAVHPRWEWILPASIIVLGAYFLLVHVWVAHLRVWNVRLRYPVAARMWFISNLGRYVPGKVWGLGTLAVMAQRRDISPTAIVGSSVLVMLIGIVAGVAVVLITGAGAVRLLLEGRSVHPPEGALQAAVILASELY